MAPRLKKADGTLHWTRPARDLVNLVRGCNPWPGATTSSPGGPLTVWRAAAVAGAASAEPGTLVAHERTLAVQTVEGLLLPTEVQPENRRPMAWPDYLRGARLAAGVRMSLP
jgi:methionyl-tRNA formyltransferase